LSRIYLRKLVESGVHFGHRVSRWNPKMKKYIYGKRNLIHIINLVETVKGLTRAVGFLKNICATGQQVVFVGTKRQVKSILQSEAERCGMPFVIERWLGGTLTNFQTIRARLKRLEQLEELESTGKLSIYSKKIQASLMRELRKIKKNLDGIREMHRLPGAMIVVDPKNEKIAVAEANKLGLPVIAILDTDCDPDDVDIVIPGNDDAIRSVQILMEKMVDSINEGKANYDEKAAMTARADDDDEFELASDRRRAQRNKQRMDKQKGGKRGGGHGPKGPMRPGDKARTEQKPASGGAKPTGGAAPAAKKPAPAPAAEKPAPAPATEKPAAAPVAEKPVSPAAAESAPEQKDTPEAESPKE